MNLAHTASISIKADNQDHVITKSIDNVTVSIVADGLGSYRDAHIASKIVCEQALFYITNCIRNKKEIRFTEVFQEAADRLDLQYDEYKDLRDYEEGQIALGTTMIVCIETSEEFKLAYIGNGAIWHLRGNFIDQTLNDSLPRVAANYLNPHMVMTGSGPKMYKLLEPETINNRTDFNPTVITLKKSSDKFGDIIILCTDGIYSYDEVRMGRGSNDGRIWVEGSERLHKLYTHLTAEIKKKAKAGLDLKLNKYLKYLQKENLLDDDATLSVHISTSALNYYQEFKSLNFKEEK